MCPCPYSITASSYLLGVLRPSETEEYRQHAGTCQHCEREIADLAPVARLLKIFKAEIEADIDGDLSSYLNP